MNKILLSFLVLGLVSCASKKCLQCKDQAVQVKLEPRSNSQTRGTLMLRESSDGKSLMIEGEVLNLTPGKHGFHVHEKRDCSAADASSAGPHFGDGHQVHAGPLHERSHRGDLGNIVANSDGRAKVSIRRPGLCLSQPDCSVMNRSFVVHATEDDLRSQPAGASGDRVACGVTEAKKCCSK